MPTILATVLTAIAIIAGGFSTTTAAQRVEGPTTGKQSEFELVGEARLKVMLWSVYDSRLFTTDGRYSNGTRPLRLEIEYLLDIKRDALIKRTREEWEAMDRDHPRQEAWLADLRALWPDIAADDVLTLELNSANVATFKRNGELLGSIDDPEFGQQFIDIWLSPDCTRPKMRMALLGKDRG